MSRDFVELEDVFTQEYWSATPPLLCPNTKGFLRRAFAVSKEIDFDHGAVEHEGLIGIAEAVGRTALQIHSGEGDLTTIDNDELIGSPDDVKYAIPGSILMLDTESVATFKDSSNTMASRLPRIADATELNASAISLFKRGKKYETSFESCYFPGLAGVPKNFANILGANYTRTVDYNVPFQSFLPYNKSYLQVDGGGAYTRTIHLVAFFQGEANEVGSRRADRAHANDNGDVSSHLNHSGGHHIGRVGEIINTTITPKVPSLSRTRSAFVCAQGAFEYAKAPSRSRVKAGKLAVQTTH